MKVAIVHNAYGKFSGEETVVENLAALLKKRGKVVHRFNRSSAEIEDGLPGKMAAFFSGIHNPFAKREFEKFLKDKRPDVVHVHNLYPLISPAILPVCKKLNIPVVMTVHNFRLVCPNGLLMNRGEICYRCLGGREYWCVLRNCEDNIFKSTGYALRTAAARLLRRYYDNVDHFICLSEFQKNILVNEGLPADRVSVMANPLSFAEAHKTGNNNTGSPIGPLGDDRGMYLPKGHHGPTGPFGDDKGSGPYRDDIAGGCPTGTRGHDKGVAGGYVAYVGRISPEKDIFTLLEAARKFGDVPFKFAGDYHRMPEVLKNKPDNCEFLGQLNAEEVASFYSNARMVVFATRCYEGFPSVLLEAMSHGLPIICSRIGGLPEIVEEGVNGVLYEPVNAEELAARIQTLWQEPDLCKKLGDAGRKKLEEKYDAKKLMDRLIGIYEKVIQK